MSKSIFIILMTGLLLGSVLHTGVLLAQENPGALPSPEEEDSPNYFMDGLIFVIGFVLLWFLFHKMLYPLLLKYYHPEYCKKLFWSLLLLYGLAWITIGAYVLFDFGFRLYLMKWVFVFLGVIWIIWFIMIMIKKDNAYA